MRKLSFVGFLSSDRQRRRCRRRLCRRRAALSSFSSFLSDDDLSRRDLHLAHSGGDLFLSLFFFVLVSLPCSGSSNSGGVESSRGRSGCGLGNRRRGSSSTSSGGGGGGRNIKPVLGRQRALPFVPSVREVDPPQPAAGVDRHPQRLAVAGAPGPAHEGVEVERDAVPPPRRRRRRRRRSRWVSLALSALVLEPQGEARDPGSHLRRGLERRRPDPAPHAAVVPHLDLERASLPGSVRPQQEGEVGQRHAELGAALGRAGDGGGGCVVAVELEGRGAGEIVEDARDVAVALCFFLGGVSKEKERRGRGKERWAKAEMGAEESFVCLSSARRLRSFFPFGSPVANHARCH